MQADLQLGEKENKKINVIHTLVQRENSVRLKKKKNQHFFLQRISEFLFMFRTGKCFGHPQDNCF